MKYAIIIFLLFFVTHLALGQNIFTGNVTNTSGVPINSANVVLTKKNENLIIAFAITDSKGNFKISYNIAADSITVKVVALGYADKLIPIANTTQQLKLVLEEKATRLPTVLVKSKPISENGDTTNYNVQAFTGKQDRVIGDVIAKLPGIEMDGNGQITFNGKAISHYYIDGLDMLGSKYNIANQNIPADLVDKVQLLKNHQDIKLLDSLNTSTEPALNLKLKKKAHNKLIGKAQVGVGASPLLWNNTLTGLNFNKGLQLITSFKSNNTGTTLATELADNISISRVGDNAEKNIKEEVINKLPSPVPDIAQKRYLFNNSNLFHFNILKVLQNKAQLKTNLSFINDYTINESTLQSTYSFPGSTPINFTEKTNGAINSNKVEGAFTYTLNNKKIYLKNTAALKLNFVNQHAALINVSPIAQYLNNPYYQYSNELTALLPVHKKIISFNSKINFSKTPQHLNVLPGQFEEVFNQSMPYDEINQNAVLQNFNTDNSIAFVNKVGKIVNEIKLGSEYIHKNLQTNLNTINSNAFFDLPDSFKNNLSWNKLRFYAESNTTIKSGNKELSIELPIEFNIISTLDKIRSTNQKRTYLFFNPLVDFGLTLSKHFDIGVLYHLQHKTGSFLQLTQGYILKDYRDINRNDSLLPLSNIQTLSLSLDYKNPLNSLFGNFSISLNQTKNNIIYNQQYDNYFITSVAIPFANFQKNFSINGSLSKYFIEQKMNVSLNGGANFYNIDLLQQNSFVKNISKSYTAGLKINYSKWTLVSLQSNTGFNAYINSVKGNQNISPALKSYKLNEQLKIDFSITKKADLYFNNEFYAVWDNSNLKKQYFFGDVGLAQKFKRTEFDLEWSNYTNNKTYTVINNFQNLRQVGTYKIRPSNIIAKFYFNF